jgi:hypothetical protein
MSFRVETAPNHYTDYQIFSSTRFNQLGQHFLSLLNPNHGTAPAPAPATDTPNENESIPQNLIQQPSDLCRSKQEQSSYYLANQDVIKQIEENFIPYQSIFPYTPPSTNNIDNNEQLTTSIPDWQLAKPSTESSRYLSSQIITIVQCRSTLSSTSFSPLSQRTNRHAVRIFINSQQQQQQQMDTFLDIVNEVLLLEPDTIKTLWDTKGERVRSNHFFQNDKYFN